jgi:hypothetical protein
MENEEVSENGGGVQAGNDEHSENGGGQHSESSSVAQDGMSYDFGGGEHSESSSAAQDGMSYNFGGGEHSENSSPAQESYDFGIGEDGEYKVLPRSMVLDALLKRVASEYEKTNTCKASISKETIVLIKREYPTQDKFVNYWRKTLKVQLIMGSDDNKKKDLYVHYSTAAKLSTTSRFGRVFNIERSQSEEVLFKQMRLLYGAGDSSEDNIDWYKRLQKLYDSRVNQYYNLMLNNICEAVYGVRISHYYSTLFVIIKY